MANKDDGGFYVKFGDKQAPTWLAWIIGPPLIVFAILLMVVALAIFIALLPIAVVGHFVLRLLGRRGFISTDDGIKIEISGAGFRKA